MRARRLSLAFGKPEILPASHVHAMILHSAAPPLRVVMVVTVSIRLSTGSSQPGVTESVLEEANDVGTRSVRMIEIEERAGRREAADDTSRGRS